VDGLFLSLNPGETEVRGKKKMHLRLAQLVLSADALNAKH
jgi:hypothetical protein